MRRITQLSVVLYLLFATALASCTNNKYGKKIKVAGTEGEVFYKESVSEKEANKVADFLKKEGYLNDKTAATVQIVKEDSEYTVRFIYDEDYYNKNKTVENEFKEFGVKMSKEAFDGEKVNIVLADEKFKDFKKIPFDENVAKPLAPAAPPAGPTTKAKDEYDHDTAGGVSFYWKGISDTESKTIADYIVENGAFAGGTAEIYMTKEDDRYILKFPVKEEYRTDPATITEVEKVSKQIKDNVFATRSYSFQMTDEKLNAIKSFDY